MIPFEFRHLKTVLIANRGEIAIRCIRACAKVGIKSISTYEESDSGSQHVTLADEAILLSGNNTSGYLNIEEIIKICKDCSVDGVFPGYGFLSENVDFARRVENAGMVFIGPSTHSILEMGQKHRARALAETANVPVAPGSPLLRTEEDAIEYAAGIGFPVILKATGGGGGMGLQVCHAKSDIQAAFAKVKGRGQSLFNDSGVFMEKYYPSSRHIEVQVFGNGDTVIHFGERECSIQRRHQKIIEECPSPYVNTRPELRKKLTQCAIAYAAQLKYKSAGTVEFLVDDVSGDFFFLEMNTRLQVEHGITEMCYNVDLMILMLLQAEHEKSGEVGISSDYLQSLQQDGPNGAAIELRLCAEVPGRNFSPSPGLLQNVKWPSGNGIRIDTWIKVGQRITPYYDPLLAKLMVHDQDRSAVLPKVLRAMKSCIIQGPANNLRYLEAILDSDGFRKGATLTNYLSATFVYKPFAIDVLSPGAFTTIQDYPARATCGHGIPQGGPMDNVSSRIANILVGNAPGVELLEITLNGPELLFQCPAVVSLCGASMPLTIDGVDKPMWSRLVIEAGQRLKIGAVSNGGCRSYLAIAGGLPDIAIYLGSKSTTASLGYGGMQGRQLQTNDYLALADISVLWAKVATEVNLPRSIIPIFDVKEVYVLHGPHDDDTFMTETDRQMMYSAHWKVGHNSNRTGIRLIGPKPIWSRKDGGAGGGHPSNCLEYGYPQGAINWGGDSALVFSVDSPNLGGLICSATVLSADLWRLGQLRPGDYFKLTPTTYEHALELKRRVEEYITQVQMFVDGASVSLRPLDLILPPGETGAILKKVVSVGMERPAVKYRQGGDSALIIEFGDQLPDLMIACRIRLLTQKLEALEIRQCVMNPSMTGLTIHFDSEVINQLDLLKTIHRLENSIESLGYSKIEVRTFRLPVVLDHPAIEQALIRYAETIRSKAVYLPDTVEYLRKANGLDTRRAVFEKLLDSEFLIVSVGFLLACPNLFPLNPISTLASQKFNPTRIATPGGTVGMGGSLFSLYPVEQPGGYQLLARTLETWDTFGTKKAFSPEKPWLWEPFDLVTFYEVSLHEYRKLEIEYNAGRYGFDISRRTLDFSQVHKDFQAAQSDPQYLKFKEGQRKGVEEMQAIEEKLYSEWQAETNAVVVREAERLKEIMEMGRNAVNIESPIDANVWKVTVEVGDTLTEGQVVCILEAMKMEINVCVPDDAIGATVQAIASRPGTTVAPGNVLIVAERSKSETTSCCGQT